jgi:guanylate kinase
LPEKQGRLFVVSGPSGVGKTTLLKMLLNKHNDKLCFSVSYTSRYKRDGEIEGVDYFFIPKEEFEKKIKENFFIEYAVVHEHYYGTSRRFIDNVLKSGTHCLLDIDVQGGLQLMAKKIDADYVFIAPPSFESLKNRLTLRATDSKEDVEIRLNNAKKELEQKDKYNKIIINDDLNRAFKELEKLFF